MVSILGRPCASRGNELNPRANFAVQPTIWHLVNWTQHSRGPSSTFSYFLTMLQVKGTHGVIEACVLVSSVNYGLCKAAKFIYKFYFASSVLLHPNTNPYKLHSLAPSRFPSRSAHHDHEVYPPLCDSPLPGCGQPCGQSSSDNTSTREMRMQSSNLSPGADRSRCHSLEYNSSIRLTSTGVQM